MPTPGNSSELLVEYFAAESLDEARSFLAIHPGLVNATSEKILDVLARSVSGDRGRYELILRLLNRANAVGLDTAYGELSGLVLPQNLDQLAKEYLQSRYVLDGARFLQQHQELFAGGAEFVLADLAGASPEESRDHALLLLSFYVVARQSDPSTALKQVYEGRADTYEWQAWGWAESQYDNTGNTRYLDLAVLCIEGAIAGPVFVRLEPGQQAAACERAGLVHHKRAQHRAGVHDLDVAVTYYERALQIESDPAHALERLGALGALWIDRYERGGDPVDLDRAVEQLEAAMPRDVIGQDPLSVPVATSLGNALRHRYMVSGGPSDIARAVSLHERIAEVPADLAMRGLRQSNLVASVMSRYDRVGDLADIDRAIQLSRRSLDGAPDDAPWRATASNNLARCLETRFRFSDQVQDLLDAIEHFGKALELGPVRDRTRNATNLGLALVAYYKRQKDDSALEQAIKMLRYAAELAAIGGIERSRPFEALRGALLARFFQSRSREDLDEAIHVGGIAVRLAAGNAPLLSSHCGGLANTYNARFEEYGDAKDLRHSAVLVRKASKAGMETNPESTLTAAVSWGETAIKRRAWKEGAEAYRYAFRASEALFTSQRDRRKKETRLREVQGLGARAAYVLTRDGKPKEAVVALERARTLLVADALSQACRPPAAHLLTRELRPQRRPRRLSTSKLRPIPGSH